MKPDGTCGVIRYNIRTNKYFKCPSKPIGDAEYCGRCTLYLEDLWEQRRKDGIA